VKWWAYLVLCFEVVHMYIESDYLQSEYFLEYCFVYLYSVKCCVIIAIVCNFNIVYLMHVLYIEFAFSIDHSTAHPKWRIDRLGLWGHYFVSTCQSSLWTCIRILFSPINGH